MKNFIVLSLLLSLFILSSNASVNNSIVNNDKHLLDVPPGMVGYVGQSAADYVSSIIFPLIFSKISGLTLPAVSGEKDGFEYSISNLKIDSVSYQSAAVSLNGPSVTLSGVNVAISCDWEFRLHIWPHLPRGSGSADISISDSSFDLVLSVTADSTGRPQLEVQNVNVNLNSVHISIHGSAWSWLFDLFADLFNHAIKNSAAQALQTEITNLVDVTADQILSTWTMRTPFSKTAEVYFNLVSNPSFGNDTASVFLEGAVENITNPVYPPVAHGGITPVPLTRMAGGDLDEFLINSGLWVAYQNQDFTFYITDTELPKVLNTSFFGPIIPPLFQQYPNELLELLVNATIIPSIAITPSGTVVNTNFDVTWIVKQAPNYPVAFVNNLEIQFLLSLDINATDISLHGQLKMLNFTLTVASSNIGTFDPTPLQNILNDFLAGPIVDIINLALATGIRLPSVDGLALSNPVIIQEQGFIHVDTDFTFVPPSALLDALDHYVATRKSVF